MKKTVFTATLISVILTAVFYIASSKAGGELLFTLFITALTFSYNFTMRLIVGAAVHAVNCKVKYNPNSFWFKPKKFEKRLYKLLKVKKWKGKMPTYSPDGFSLEKHTMQEIIQNMCSSEVVHEVIIPLCFVPILFCFLCDEPKSNIPVFLITSIISAAFDWTFVMMQRYNRPRVIKILKHKEKTDTK